MVKPILSSRIRVLHPKLVTSRRPYCPTTVALADDDEDDEGDKKKPKKIRIKGGGTISTAEHTRRLEKARTQERDKMQSKIIEAEKAARIATKKLNKAQGALDALKEVKTSDGTVDVEELLNKAHKKWTKLHEASSSDESSTLSSEVAELRKRLTKYETRELRRKLIAEAGGEETMIVELVKGTTEEEIEASIEAAQAAFKKYGGKKKKKSDDDEDDDDLENSDEDDEDEDDDSDEDENEDDDDAANRHGKRRTAPTIPKAGEKGRKRRGDRVLDGVSTLSTADYAKNRPRIMERLKARYGNGGANPFARRSAGRR